MAVSTHRRFHLFLIPLLCLSGVARAQTGGASATVTGSVSGMVALSSHPAARVNAGTAGVVTSRNDDGSLTVTLSGTARGLTEVSIPIQVRSNTAYRLYAAAKADGCGMSRLSVVDVRPGGSLVAADAAEALRVAAAFDARPGARKTAPTGGTQPSLLSRVELLSGPRVSLGGALASPQNALEVTLSLAVEPRAGEQVWAVELLLSAAPAAHL